MKPGADLGNHRRLNDCADDLHAAPAPRRLGVYELPGQSFKTTNCLESVNALVEERCAKVDHWKSSNQRHRRLTAALLDIEPRLRRGKGHQHLGKLQTALRRALDLNASPSREQRAA